MSKQPKPTAEPSTASNRLTPQEIVSLRESAHRMDAEMQAILAARKQPGGGGIGFQAGVDRGDAGDHEAGPSDAPERSTRLHSKLFQNS